MTGGALAEFIASTWPFEHGHEQEELRSSVRQFLDSELADRRFHPRCDSWLVGYDPDFSRELGTRGWLGLTWPERYGGRGRSAIDRVIVTEELLSAGAPIAAHWAADRQVGPSLMRYGSEAQRQEFLPAIARGECFFALGMSEPDAGSDLAAVRTSGERTAGGWNITGTKLWVSGAHYAHAMVVLARTSSGADDRHEGLSQFILRLPSPAVRIHPIRLLTGHHHFNEVQLDEVFVPDEMVLGEIGNGWNQIISELVFERSGPERFLSTFPLLDALASRVSNASDERAHHAIGSLAAELWVLRQLCFQVAAAVDAGTSPAAPAAVLKDLGTQFEHRVVEVSRSFTREVPRRPATDRFEQLLMEAVLQAPGFTLRGGTTEILRTIVARSLLAP